LLCNPGYAEVHNNLGRALSENGELDKAIAEWKKALELNPGYAEAHNNLGTGLFRKGKLEEAVREWERAVEVEPEFAEARFNLGNTLYLRGRVAEAVAQWRRGLGREPNHLPALNRTAWVLATCPEAGVRNGREAVELAERAAGLTGGREAAILDTLAAAYAEAGRFGEAVETALRALTLARQQNEQALGEALKGRMGLYEARSAFREAPQGSRGGAGRR